MAMSNRIPYRRFTAHHRPEPPRDRARLELAGGRAADEQAAYIDRSDVDTLGSPTPTDIDEGELPAGAEDDPPEQAARRDLLTVLAEGALPWAGATDDERLELLTELELRAEETDDPIEAVEEGFAYVPPIDPPIIPGRPGSRVNAEIASGLGLSALDEPFDEGHHGSFLTDDDEISARVREALRADSSTWPYADRIAIDTRNGVVRLRGVVDDLIDNDNLLAVAAYALGVTEVIDELRVRGLG
jgi:hypothetical protein